MRELEIKAQVHDKQKLLGKIREISVKLSEPFRQLDIVYAQIIRDEDHRKNNWLRVRTENDKHIFTLKRAVTGELDNIEHETEVSEPEELKKILALLGYEQHSVVDKIRQKGTYGSVEICLDDVAGLGIFIEAEIMIADDADYDEIRVKLWEVFNKLGIKKTDEVTKGYDVLTRERAAKK